MVENVFFYTCTTTFFFVVVCVLNPQNRLCTVFTRSWWGHPAWSPQPRLGSRHIPLSRRTAPLHSGRSPSPRHPAPSRLTAGCSTLRRKAQNNHSLTGKDVTHTPSPTDFHIWFPSSAAVYCYNIYIHAFQLVFNLYSRYTCLSRFTPHKQRTTDDKHLVTDPPSDHGGIKLPTGCTVNSLLSNSQTTVLSSAGYYHECLNLICLFSICLHLPSVRNVLVSGKLWLDQVCHFSVLDLENAAEWKIRLSCFCQLLLKPPEENKICMGRSIDVTHTGSTFKSTNWADSMAHFSFSYPPEEERLMYIW